MKRGLAAASLLAAAAFGFAPRALSARESEPHVMREGDPAEVQYWFAAHRSYVDRARQGNLGLVFMGDSLTFGWLAQGKPAWQSTFAAPDAVAFGIGGDRTSDLLWRIEHGELASAEPRMVVVLIGTNDLGIGAGAHATADGVRECVRALERHLPSATTIVLHAILPRGAGGAHTPMRVAVATVNSELAKLSDGRRIRFLDLATTFVESDGSLRTALYETDLLHVSAEGYRVWAASLRPALEGLRRR